MENSSVTSPWAALFLSAISSIVSCKNLAISSLTLSSFFRRSSCRTHIRSSEIDHGDSRFVKAEEQKYRLAYAYELEHKGERSAYLLGLCLKGGWQHVREKLQNNRKQKLHKWNDDKNQKGQKAEDICTRPQEL